MTRHPISVALALVLLLSIGANAADVLQNELIRATFDARGLKSITEVATGRTFEPGADQFSVTIDGKTASSDGLAPKLENAGGHRRTYVFESGERTVRVMYELLPGWRFISKQLVLSQPARQVRINRIEMLGGLNIGDVPVTEVRSGVFLQTRQDSGVFLALQNPFLKWNIADQRAVIAYEPDMDWKPEYGPFASDRMCIGFYHDTGTRYPLHMVPEWKFVPGELAQGKSLDWGQIEAMTDCERAFLLDHRNKSVRVNVGWCENDYQIDAATEAGREEYKRIISRAAALGCQDVLYAPNNSALASLKENTDAWGWEEVLWLGLGQRIRKGEWDVHKDATPSSVSEMLDYAKSKNVRLLAYVYPSLPFRQDPMWTAWTKNAHARGFPGADTGLRSFQDWLLDQLETFHAKTGIGGFSFDHWFINLDGASSKYAQWYGCRRVLQELRQHIPDVVIDGRQEYQYFGPWTWLAGSYPHPTSTDEQPQSFRAFPDLHLDRVSADRQRFAAWWYRVENFCPPEILPGFITHQTPRNDAKGVMRRDRFRAKDWDYLGWKYSLISSIATAPMNHVVNMIPARDPEEYDAFSSEDQRWLRGWLDWTDHNRDILLNLRPILGQPMIGRVDGTAAFKGDHGFIFLFNPNYRAMQATLPLDRSIGLTTADRFALRQLYPDAQKGRVLAVGQKGDRLSIPLRGTDALVLEVSPLTAEVHEPLLIGSTGKARLRDGSLEVMDVTGESGTMTTLRVLVPDPAAVRSLKVNGSDVAFSRTGDSIQASIRFQGTPFSQAQQIGRYDPTFTGGHFHGRIAVPARVFQQLQERAKRWAVHYSQDDLKATWLGPSRLLLFVNVADPSNKMEAGLKIDGHPVPLIKAYSSIYASAVDRTFVGWYADVSTLAPDHEHDFDLSVPKLNKGQFQGLFFDNVEPEYTLATVLLPQQRLGNDKISLPH